MKIFKYIALIVFVVLLSNKINAQEDKKDAYLQQQTDSILGEPILLDEIVIDFNKINAEENAKKRFLTLQRRVYRVYPYAKIASEKLTLLNKGMASLKTNKEKNKYFKIVENYLSGEFEQKLKNLSRKDGQILVKLIHRQTGITTFDLIKDYKSGWKAFWSNNIASLYDINLKTKYNPMDVNEDYLIETILVRAFNARKLVAQNSAMPLNYDVIEAHWQEKLAKKEVK
ncbi:MAG: DUF4294 domain-containing protein [Flavobacterium sp.]